MPEVLSALIWVRTVSNGYQQTIGKELCKGMTEHEILVLIAKASNETWRHARIQREGQGVRTPSPLKNHKNIGFLSNTGPDPLKIHKATKPAFNVGPLSARQQNAI